MSYFNVLFTLMSFHVFMYSHFMFYVLSCIFLCISLFHSLIMSVCHCAVRSRFMLLLLRSLIKHSSVCISEVATAAMHTMSVGMFVHLSVLFELRFLEFQLAILLGCNF